MLADKLFIHCDFKMSLNNQGLLTFAVFDTASFNGIQEPKPVDHCSQGIDSIFVNPVSMNFHQKEYLVLMPKILFHHFWGHGFHNSLKRHLLSLLSYFSYFLFYIYLTAIHTWLWRPTRYDTGEELYLDIRLSYRAEFLPALDICDWPVRLPMPPNEPNLLLPEILCRPHRHH
mmetsp:Transcript_8567/g.9809  ORF Transcript_8567/g.9809 Transcript_8567/m.9809 type:complete len:173 (+) Transcript_8567:404-922(+)